MNRHKITAKYCLKKQGKNKKECKQAFNCKYCKKNFTRKSVLETHWLSCVERKTSDIKNICENKLLEKDKLIEKLESQVSALQNKLENVAIKAVEKPTYQYNKKINQIINNLQPITEEHLKEQSKYLTTDHIKRGIPGYVEFALEYPFKDRVVCVDFARKKIKYKDTDENVISDPEMAKLIQKFFYAINERNQSLIDDYVEKIRGKLFDLDYEDDKTEEETEKRIEADILLWDEVKRVINYKMGVLNGAKGDTSDFQKNFVKEVCTKISS